MLRDSPVVIFNELHQLLLGVGLSWDEHRIVHEGLVEVHLVELQLQSLGNLQDATEGLEPVTEHKRPGSHQHVDKICLSQNIPPGKVHVS